MSVTLRRDSQNEPNPATGQAVVHLKEKHRETRTNGIVCLDARRVLSSMPVSLPQEYCLVACFSSVVHPGGDAPTSEARCKTQPRRAHRKV